MIFSGNVLKLQIFGGSHTDKIGVEISGLPQGIKIDYANLKNLLSRRAPGKNALSTSRKEADEPHFTAGVENNIITENKITAVIYNTNTRSKDYENQRFVPRPGHADYTAFVKYGLDRDFAGGGSFSGRMTAPLCIAGAICMQILKEKGINILSRIASIGDVCDKGELLSPTDKNDFPTVDSVQGEKMQEKILKAKAEGDSVGGVVEISVTGLPAGLGGPMFTGVESEISAIIFGIPAVKGIEFGAGFNSAKLSGSENNDEFYYENGIVKTYTNNCGGILGGITNGMPLEFKVAFKPTPSIAKEQRSVDLKAQTNTKITVGGRHDPCVVPRAVPAVEAATAVALLDLILQGEKEAKNL